MRYVDADKLYPDCRTIDGKLAISQSQLANAPTVEYPFYQEAYQKIDEARKVIWDTSLPDACKVMKLRKLIDYECGAKMKGGKEE